MTIKCFWCEKKNWRPNGDLKPFCSTKCKTAFEQSPARIKRLKWCEKRIEGIERKKRTSERVRTNKKRVIVKKTTSKRTLKLNKIKTRKAKRTLKVNRN